MKIVALFLIVFGLSEGFTYRPQSSVLSTKERLPKCQAPNGAGLEPILKEIQKYIPEDRVLMIILTALTSDKEVQDVMTYVTSQDGLARIHRIFKSDEVTRVIRFACQDLHLDVIHYINSIATLLGLPLLDPIGIRLPRSIGKTSRPGLRGLVRDIFDVIALDDIKLLVQDKIDSDEYVKLAVKKINSAEGMEIMNRLASSEDIQKLVEDLLELGANLMAIFQDLRCIFGWNTPNENEGGNTPPLSY